MKVIILEDELVSRHKVEKYINHYNPEIEIKLSTDNFKAVINYLINNKVDLILADIKVFDGNVFDKLTHHSIVCPFIFITAYDDYAFEALSHYGMGYLLKPYTYSQFEETMNRFQQLNSKIKPDLEAALFSLRSTQYRERFIVKAHRKAKLIAVEAISFIEIEGGVIFIYDLENHKYMLKENATLTAVMESLNPRLFFRINKSIILHSKMIQNFTTYGKDKLAIHLKNTNHHFITSTSKTPLFKKWINQ